MLVSVIMPVKNAQETIISAVNSILQQSFISLELIIIDDKSTDDTQELLKTITDTRVAIIENKGKGIADALNTGLKHARGDYIARMDADDISLPIRLERQALFAMRNAGYDVISCFVSHDSKGPKNQEGYNKHIKWLNSIITPVEHYANRFADAPIAHPTAFFKRSLPEKYGYYSNKGLPEDFELWLRWMSQGVQFAKVSEVLYEWSDYPNRSSRVHPNYSSDKFYKVKAEYFKLWWQENNLDREIWIWGYGKEVFNKSEPLTHLGIKIKGFIDVIERPGVVRNVRSYLSVNKSKDQFFLIYVSDRQGKVKIAEYLLAQKMTVNEDYLFMS